MRWWRISSAHSTCWLQKIKPCFLLRFLSLGSFKCISLTGKLYFKWLEGYLTTSWHFFKTHCSLVTPRGVVEQRHNPFRSWRFSCSARNHYTERLRLLINSTLRNELQRLFNECTNILAGILFCLNMCDNNNEPMFYFRVGSWRHVVPHNKLHDFL